MTVAEEKEAEEEEEKKEEEGCHRSTCSVWPWLEQRSGWGKYVCLYYDTFCDRT